MNDNFLSLFNKQTKKEQDKITRWCYWHNIKWQDLLNLDDFLSSLEFNCLCIDAFGSNTGFIWWDYLYDDNEDIRICFYSGDDDTHVSLHYYNNNGDAIKSKEFHNVYELITYMKEV